jgi:hypothetical protein
LTRGDSDFFSASTSLTESGDVLVTATYLSTQGELMMIVYDQNHVELGHATGSNGVVEVVLEGAAGSTVLIEMRLADGTEPTDPIAYTLYVSEFTQAPPDTNAPEVIGRYTFYNNSSYDDNGEAVTIDDANAIASDKVALLPGETASYANYTNYRFGINGIMIDVLDMPDPSILTVDDFQLHVGNSADPATWDVAPPATLTVLEGAGVDGSDRLVLTWADQSITHTWLQVRMLANTNTNLDVDDVFYFGNAVGEVGNAARVAGASGNNADVNIFDISGAWSHLHGSDTADITDPYDINKDGAVNIFDISAMWSNLRGGNGALQLGNIVNGTLAVTQPTLEPMSQPQDTLTNVQTLAMALAQSNTSAHTPIANTANTLPTDNTNRIRLLLVD